MSAPEPVSRRAFFATLARSRVVFLLICLLAAALGYALWEGRETVGGIAALLLLCASIALLGGLVPLLVGFAIQFFYPRPVREVAASVAAVVLFAASWQLSGTLPITVDESGFSWSAAMLSVLLYSAFVFGGAALHRRFIPRKQQGSASRDGASKML